VRSHRSGPDADRGYVSQVGTSRRVRFPSRISPNRSTLIWSRRASLQNTRKRAVTLTEVLDTANGDVDSDERQQKRSKLGMGNPSYFQPGPMNSGYIAIRISHDSSPTSHPSPPSSSHRHRAAHASRPARGEDCHGRGSCRAICHLFRALSPSMPLPRR
jgi:hypothetical protein